MLRLDGTTEIVYDNLNENVTTLMKPKNWIINGGFDVWQRGTSQTVSVYGSDDRWTNEHIGSTKTHSRQAFTIGQIDVPNNPTYFSRTIISSVVGAGNYTFKSQRIEDVSKLAGKNVSISFWAKADASKNISIDLRQDFGTGGSTAVSRIGVQKFALTTSWQRFTKTISIPSVSGKTIGANNYLSFRIWFDAGSNFNANTDSLGNQSGTFDIANVSLVEGSVPIEWQTEAYADVLRQCQRYYWRIDSTTSLQSFTTTGTAGTATNMAIPIILHNEMRVAPTSIEYATPTNLYVLDTVSTYPVSSVALTKALKNFVELSVTTSTNMTLWRPGWLSGNVGAYIAFNAEL